MGAGGCPHRAASPDRLDSEKVRCDDCPETVNLRICLGCGHVGCCESRQAHNTRHFEATGHPWIRPHRCGYDWLWCYACGAYLT